MIGFAVLMLTFAAMPFLRAQHGSFRDYGKWYQTGQVTLHGGDIYDKHGGRTFQFMYPPTAAVLLAPLSAFGKVPLIAFLVVASSGAWIACVLLAVYLVTGKPGGQHPLLYVAPTLVSAFYCWDIYILGQPNLLLLACMLGAFACLRTGRHWGTGGVIAFAAAVKAFPILAVVYLIWRRHWRATLWTAAFLVFFLILLPAPFRGFQRNLQDLKTWNEGMALRYDEHSISQRPARGYSWKNQSLIAVANRLLRPVDADREPDRVLHVNFAHLPFRHVNIVIAVVGLALCLFYVTAMPPFAQRTPHTDAIEYAMLLLLMLMFTPLSFSYFYVWLLYPITVGVNLYLTAPADSREKRLILAWLVVCVVLMSFMLPMSVLRPLQAMGNSFFACVLLLIGFGWKLRQCKLVAVPAAPSQKA
jgi:hypothetical protein